MQSKLSDDFRDAWLALTGNDFATRIARDSLEASALGVPELEQALFGLRNAYQAQLDLRLTGASVTGHSTTAEKFADFIRGVADAVRAIQKAAMGRQRLASSLLVTPLPGSIRIQLTAAAPLAKQVDLDAARTETAESAALQTVATLLERAEADSSSPDSTVLDGMTAALPAKARAAMLRVAQSVSTAGWEVDGSLRRADRSPYLVHITKGGADRLLRSLGERVEETFTLERRGLLDGQRRSIGAMWFIPDGEAPLEAAVLDSKLFDEVAALSAEESRVFVRLKATVVHPPSTSAASRRSYSLLSIDPLPPEDVPLDDSEG